MKKIFKEPEPKSNTDFISNINTKQEAKQETVND